jgi:general L-amino acid transport system permease protein
MTDTTVAPMTGVTGYVRREAAQALPPPSNLTGWQGWVRENLLSSPFNIAMTIISALLLYWIC